MYVSPLVSVLLGFKTQSDSIVVIVTECLVLLDLENLLLKANNTCNFMSQIFEHVAISSGKWP